MKPYLDESCIVVVEKKPFENLKLGQNVLFRAKWSTSIVAHRLKRKFSWGWQTKRDALSKIDPNGVDEENYAGYLSAAPPYAELNRSSPNQQVGRWACCRAGKPKSAWKNETSNCFRHCRFNSPILATRLRGGSSPGLMEQSGPGALVYERTSRRILSDARFAVSTRGPVPQKTGNADLASSLFSNSAETVPAENGMVARPYRSLIDRI